METKPEHFALSKGDAAGQCLIRGILILLSWNCQSDMAMLYTRRILPNKFKGASSWVRLHGQRLKDIVLSTVSISKMKQKSIILVDCTFTREHIGCYFALARHLDV